MTVKEYDKWIIQTHNYTYSHTQTRVRVRICTHMNDMQITSLHYLSVWKYLVILYCYCRGIHFRNITVTVKIPFYNNFMFQGSILVTLSQMMIKNYNLSIFKPKVIVSDPCVKLNSKMLQNIQVIFSIEIL